MTRIKLIKLIGVFVNMIYIIRNADFEEVNNNYSMQSG